MHHNVKFLELIKLAKYHMEEQGFTDVTTFQYLRTWRSVYNFALSKGIEYFSAELAETYMKEKYDLSIGENCVDKSTLSPYTTKNIRALKTLTDFLIHGFISKETRGEKLTWPKEFEKVCKDFISDFQKRGFSPDTCRRHELNLYRFIMFCGTRKVKKPNEIQIDHVYDYYKTICHFSKPVLSTLRGTLARAFKYFHMKNVSDEDLSEYVPKICYYAKAKLSKTWSKEEIKQILSAIDTANALGKRDYAIMSIAANLGLRAGDIVRLKIDDFDWKNGTINIIQNKTGEPLSLPISECIGKAVIDYWKNGRPNTVAKELFVQHTLPFKGISSSLTYHIFNTYFFASNIYAPAGRRYGLHSLRHSLASRLLEKDTPINIIGNILGHVNSETAKQYIRIDVNKLRECALEVPNVK